MTAPTVAVAIHDGWYGTGTGAGRSSHALLGAVAGGLGPAYASPSCPFTFPLAARAMPHFHTAARAQIAAVPHQIIPLTNGTKGRHRFGGLAAFRYPLAALTVSASRRPRQHERRYLRPRGVGGGVAVITGGTGCTPRRDGGLAGGSVSLASDD